MFKRQKQHKASFLIIAVLISGMFFYALNGEVIGNEKGFCLWCKLQSRRGAAQLQEAPGSGEGRGCRREEEAGGAVGTVPWCCRLLGWQVGIGPPPPFWRQRAAGGEQPAGMSNTGVI